MLFALKRASDDRTLSVNAPIMNCSRNCLSEISVVDIVMIDLISEEFYNSCLNKQLQTTTLVRKGMAKTLYYDVDGVLLDFSGPFSCFGIMAYIKNYGLGLSFQIIQTRGRLDYIMI